MLLFSMISGIVLGVLGIFLMSYAIFSSTHSWGQSLCHWLCGLIGACLLLVFWRHTLYYMGLLAIAGYVCETPKTAGAQWNSYSRSLIQSLFTVQITNETQYSQPVIFLINHIAKSRPFDEFCLALISQPHLRIAALPRKPNSYPDIIMKSNNYLPVKHGSGYQDFVDTCTSALQQGDSILVFPEGKNTESQIHWTQLAEFQSGVFDVAIATGSLVVPLLLEAFNCENGWIKGYGQAAQPLRLHYLEAIDPHEFADAHPDATDEELSGRLKYLVRYQMNQKLKRIFAKSLPEDQALIMEKTE